MIFFQILPFFRFAEPWNPFWGRCTCIDDWSTKILCFHILVPLMDSIRKPSLFLTSSSYVLLFKVALEIQSVSFFYIVNFSVFTTFSRSVFFYLVTTRLAALQDTGSARYGFYDSPKLFNLKFTIASIVLIAYK